MRDRLLLVVGALTANAPPIGDAEVVVDPGPVLRVGLACPNTEHDFEMTDGALEVVSPHPARAHRIGTADNEPKLSPHLVPRLLQRPSSELALARKELLSQQDPVLEILGLSPDLQAIGELDGFAGVAGWLRGDLSHRKQDEQESTRDDMKAAHVCPSRILRQAWHWARRARHVPHLG